MLRVTNMSMTNNMIRYMQDNLQRSARLQEEESTGKTIIRPSDNPAEVSHVMEVNATIAGNEQFTRNIDDGLSYLNQSDTALNTIGKTLQSAKELALQGVNGTMNQADRDVIAAQIDKMIDTLIDLGNSSLGGKYLFAGQKNSQPPFYRYYDPVTGKDAVYYRGDTNKVMREIIFGYEYEVDSAGVDASAAEKGVFGKLEPSSTITDPLDSSQNMLKVSGGPLEVLQTLRDNLQSGDTAAIDQSIDNIETAFDNEQVIRVRVGARTKHLEAVKDQLADQDTNLQNVLSTVQDADVTKLTIQAAQNNLVYQASLSTATKLLQTSLLNYLG